MPTRIVYGIVRGLFPLSYHRGEINVTPLGPERSSVEWKIELESNPVSRTHRTGRARARHRARAGEAGGTARRIERRSNRRHIGEIRSR